MSDVLAKIKKSLELAHARGRPPGQTDLYAEEDRCGVVWIRHDDGTLHSFMSKNVFDALGFVLTPKAGIAQTPESG